MTEEHAPSALLTNAARAEDARFDFVAIARPDSIISC
jgi:hypothetical protein